jgi:hypothetical protein
LIGYRLNGVWFDIDGRRRLIAGQLDPEFGTTFWSVGGCDFPAMRSHNGLANGQP